MNQEVCSFFSTSFKSAIKWSEARSSAGNSIFFAMFITLRDREKRFRRGGPTRLEILHDELTPKEFDERIIKREACQHVVGVSQYERIQGQIDCLMVSERRLWVPISVGQLLLNEVRNSSLI